ncbi:MAG: hypothetical protein PHP53_24250 [Prolixibacteraceae bacterium]|nr:hypothetical protein [Prolixibacteraceae bacterium]
MENFILPSKSKLMVDRGRKQYVFIKTKIAKKILRILTQLDAAKSHVQDRNEQLGGIPYNVAKNLLNEIELGSNIFLQSMYALCEENNIKLKDNLINKKKFQFYLKTNASLQKEEKNRQIVYLLNFSTKNILQVLTQLDYFLDFICKNSSIDDDITKQVHNEVKKMAKILSNFMHDLCEKIEFNYHPPKGFKN